MLQTELAVCEEGPQAPLMTTALKAQLATIIDGPTGDRVNMLLFRRKERLAPMYFGSLATRTGGSKRKEDSM